MNVVITVEDYLYEFYKKIGESAGKIPPEKVMADALFRLAGDLSQSALMQKKEFNCSRKNTEVHN